MKTLLAKTSVTKLAVVFFLIGSLFTVFTYEVIKPAHATRVELSKQEMEELKGLIQEVEKRSLKENGLITKVYLTNETCSYHDVDEVTYEDDKIIVRQKIRHLGLTPGVIKKICVRQERIESILGIQFNKYEPDQTRKVNKK